MTFETLAHDASDMVRDMMLDQPEKYRCEHCGRRFQWRYQLTSHRDWRRRNGGICSIRKSGIRTPNAYTRELAKKHRSQFSSWRSRLWRQRALEDVEDMT